VTDTCNGSRMVGGAGRDFVAQNTHRPQGSLSLGAGDGAVLPEALSGLPQDVRANVVVLRKVGKSVGVSARVVRVPECVCQKKNGTRKTQNNKQPPASRTGKARPARSRPLYASRDRERSALADMIQDS
jgi:hypothetical protein